MMIYPSSATQPDTWVGFELSVLRRMKFHSVALPFSAMPHLGMYLKRWGVRVAVNDLDQSSHTQSVAFIENNAESLSKAEMEALIDDGYAPGFNDIESVSARWFNETDALWLDNVRSKVDEIDSPYKKALALCLCMNVGDYVQSFDDETRHLRQPLSLPDVFRRAWQSQPAPVNNAEQNKSSMRPARDFIAEQFKADLMLLHLPKPQSLGEIKHQRGFRSWREEWLRGSDNLPQDLEASPTDKLGAPVETKRQYLSLVEEILQVASHVPAWAISHVENGFLSTDELVETISRIRKVGTIFVKDFSELTGAKAAMIMAT